MDAVPKAACAPSHEAVPWDSIDWTRCRRNVKRLQARIVKATEAGRWGKVKALQWLLTHSFSGKALAVNRVTENKGKNTPGVDGETWSTPEEKTDAMKSLQRSGVSTSTVAAGLHPEVERQAETSRHSDDEGPRDAGTPPARARPGIRDHSRQELLRLSQGSLGARRTGTVLRRTREAFEVSPMGSRRRHQRMLRQHRPRLDAQRISPWIRRFSGSG